MTIKLRIAKSDVWPLNRSEQFALATLVVSFWCGVLFGMVL